ncbi:MAG: type I polyketide synthase, partial [Umezawaea sp.]
DVRLLTGSQEWPEGPRRAGVSSFGVSGTNAHVIVEAVDVAEPESTPEVGAVPLLLSGADVEAVRRQADRLAAHLAGPSAPGLADVAFSASTTRAALEHRAVVVAATAEQARTELLAFARGEEPASVVVGTADDATHRVGLVFSGQGSQRVGMGRELAARFPVFAAAFDEVCGRFDGLADVVWSSDALHRTGFTQPGLFAFEVALYRLLESWGVHADVLLGHSIGELAAAHVAGLWSLADACRVVGARGRLMEALPEGGAMVAVQATEAEVVPLLSDAVGIAAVNGPESVVVSGAEDAVLALAAGFAAEGRKTKRLRVSHAFHSPLLEPMLAEFRAVLEQVEFRTPSRVVVSNLTGRVAGDELGTPEYWVRHAREAVRFADGMAAAGAEGVTTFLEVGPDGLLAGLTPDVDVVSASRAGRPEVETLFTALGRLHVRGVPIAWPEVFAGAGAHRVELPTYAFERTHYWLSVPRPAVAVTDGWTHRVAWKPLPEPARRELDGTWLLAVPHGHEDDPLVRQALGDSGTQLTPLVLGTDDVEPGVLAAKLAEVARDGVDGVLSLLASAGDALPGRRALPTGLALTTALVQAMSTAGVQAPLWCLTTGATAAGGEPVRHPGQAPVWGLGTVIAQEHPELWGGLVDLPEQPDERTWPRVLGIVAAGHEDQVAVRSAVLAKRLVPAPAESGDAWRPHGTVLVTGGTGALGAHVARSLAAGGAEHVVLTSRSGRAAPDAADLEAELTGLGTRVTVVACDVSDRDALASLLDTLPDLDAVVHTAGVLDDGVLDALTPARFDRVLTPKLTATIALHELTRHLDLSAFVLFSSAAGTLGNAGQGNYAAANAFLDAFAQYRRGLGLPATTVAWGAWAGAGMAEDVATAERLRRDGVSPMDPERAVAALWRAAGQRDPFAVVADIDWGKLAAGLPRPNRLLQELPGVREAAGADRPVTASVVDRLAAAEPADRHGIVVELVVAAVAAVLGHATGSVRADRPFKDLGFDSLTGVELRNRLATATGSRLPATLVFDHPTPAALADHLLVELRPAAPVGSRDAFAELDRLETAMAAADDQLRGRVTTRLTTLLARWAGTTTGARDLREASRDELFDFIDNELGVAD